MYLFPNLDQSVEFPGKFSFGRPYKQILIFLSSNHWILLVVSVQSIIGSTNIGFLIQQSFKKGEVIKLIFPTDLNKCITNNIPIEKQKNRNTISCHFADKHHLPEFSGSLGAENTMLRKMLEHVCDSRGGNVMMN